MPRKCNDHDLVTYSELRPTKDPAPPVWPIPEFKPFVYTEQSNIPRVPTPINTSNPEALWDLFFLDSTIEMLINATNRNA